jgi:hypothetical protein
LSKALNDPIVCRFLTIALGSNAEVEAQIAIAGDIGLIDIAIAGDIGLIDQATVTTMLDLTDHIPRMIRRLMQYGEPPG